MGLGFGLLSAQARPGETDWTRAYDETVRVVVEAERMGLGSIWTAEHHFADDGCMPSPLVVMAALARATTRIELGTGVVLAPLHHPLRLAEDAATVQLLSHGRLVLGLGLGWSETEYRGLGVDPRTRGRAMEEILRILPLAWSGDPFRHDGEIYDLPRLGVRPRPSPAIPVLIGGSAEPAIRRAARHADGIVSSAPPDVFVDQVRWMLDECERVGRDAAHLRLVNCLTLLPGASRGSAIARYGPALRAMDWKLSDMEASATRSLGAVPPRMPVGRTASDARTVLAGPPEMLVEALLATRRRAGVRVEFVARSYLPPLAIEEQLELMQVLADGVAPHV